jgi:glyoxylase-like metal-dependent hydrolase (beta-lactamase superfamily II)
MGNLVYIVGSRRTRRCVLVDPAWDVGGALDAAEALGLNVVGALVTHYHPDHVGGDLLGRRVQGIATFLERVPAKVHVHRVEARGLRLVTGASVGDLEVHDDGDRFELGDVVIEFVHTPGHTPGSQCFLLRDGEAQHLVSGDTLFMGGCGRVDLPGADPNEMYRSLHQRLARLDADVVLHPGHDYGGQLSSTLREERTTNVYLRVDGLDAWYALLGLCRPQSGLGAGAADAHGVRKTCQEAG